MQHLTAACHPDRATLTTGRHHAMDIKGGAMSVRCIAQRRQVMPQKGVTGDNGRRRTHIGEGELRANAPVVIKELNPMGLF